jgi:D-xylose 1-dehydrogenase
MASYPELRDRAVLLTGGANGIGAATVRAFSRQGAQVFFCDTDVTAGRALQRELKDHALFAKVDLLEETEIRNWIAKIGERGRPIHVLVNNAAADPRIALLKTSTADWDRLFARNLRACFLTSREVVPYMPKRGAAIVNLASITFHLAPAEMAAYVATKGGVLGFTRSLARELGPRRIRVNAVSPGWIMTERQLREFITPGVKKMILKSQSIPELLQPEEIAEVILFLTSDASRAITGQEVLADRGWMHS